MWISQCRNFTVLVKAFTKELLGIYVIFGLDLDSNPRSEREKDFDFKISLDLGKTVGVQWILKWQQILWTNQFRKSVTNIFNVMFQNLFFP